MRSRARASLWRPAGTERRPVHSTSACVRLLPMGSDSASNRSSAFRIVGRTEASPDARRYSARKATTPACRTGSSSPDDPRVRKSKSYRSMPDASWARRSDSTARFRPSVSAVATGTARATSVASTTTPARQVNDRDRMSARYTGGASLVNGLRAQRCPRLAARAQRCPAPSDAPRPAMPAAALSVELPYSGAVFCPACQVLEFLDVRRLACFLLLLSVHVTQEVRHARHQTYDSESRCRVLQHWRRARAGLGRERLQRRGARAGNH